MYCLESPYKFCLPSSKGKTRGTNGSNPFKTSKILKEFFSEEMRSLEDLIYNNQESKDDRLQSRFSWLQNYL